MIVNTEARRIADGHPRAADIEFLAAISKGCAHCDLDDRQALILFAETYLAQPIAERSVWGNAVQVATAAVQSLKSQREVAGKAADRQRQVDCLAAEKFQAKFLLAMRDEHPDLWSEAEDEAEAALPLQL